MMTTTRLLEVKDAKHGQVRETNLLDEFKHIAYSLAGQGVPVKVIKAVKRYQIGDVEVKVNEEEESIVNFPDKEEIDKCRNPVELSSFFLPLKLYLHKEKTSEKIPEPIHLLLKYWMHLDFLKQGLPGDEDEELATLLFHYADILDDNLVQAALKDDEAGVRQALKNGANANISVKDHPLLVKTAELGFVDSVKLLIENGADIEAKGAYGNTSLIVAAEKGHASSVNFLLENKADPDAKNNSNTTALLEAARNKELEVARLLLSRSANANYVMPGCFDSTAIKFAVWNKDAAMVALLLPHTSCELVVDAFSESLVGKSSDVEVVSTFVKLLGIEKINKDLNGADLFLKSFPLKLEVCQLLVDAGIDVRGQDPRGRSALHYAVSKWDGAMLAPLVKAGVDINVKDTDGLTPLMLAVKNTNMDAVRILIELPQFFNIKVDTTNLLAIALGNFKHTNLLEYIFSLVGEDEAFRVFSTLLNQKNKDPRIVALINLIGVEKLSEAMSAPMISAVKRDDLYLARLLIDAGLDVNSARDGETALMVAAERKNLGMVTLLLENGADIFSKRKDGKTAYEIAFEAEDWDMEILELVKMPETCKCVML